jgi:hypothetical protein
MAKKRKELDRRPVGIHVEIAKSGPLAYQLYEVMYDNGKEYERVIERGAYIHGWPGMRPTHPTPAEKRKEKANAKFNRPDLNRYIETAAILLQPIADACWEADKPLPPKKRRK